VSCLSGITKKIRPQAFGASEIYGIKPLSFGGTGQEYSDDFPRRAGNSRLLRAKQRNGGKADLSKRRGRIECVYVMGLGEDDADDVFFFDIVANHDRRNQLRHRVLNRCGSILHYDGTSDCANHIVSYRLKYLLSIHGFQPNDQKPKHQVSAEKETYSKY